MTYKESLTAAMDSLAADPACCFVGYGITRGRAMGTLANVSAAQLIECPVAENLMVGLAIGLALAGRKPVVYFERADFLLNAADAIVNHLDKMAMMSRGEFKPAVILRVTVGNRQKPLFTGETHTQDFSDAFRAMAYMPVFKLLCAEDILHVYEGAKQSQAWGQSVMITEYKDLI